MNLVKNLNKYKLVQTSSKLAVVLVLFLFLIGDPIFAVSQEEINHIKSRVNNLNAEKQTLQAQVAAFDNQIYTIQVQINQTQGKLNELDGKINSLKNQITKAEEDILRQKELMKEYLKTMYIEGQTSTIELVVKSDSFSDFVNQSEYMSRMQQNVQETAEKIAALKAQLESDKKLVEIEQEKTKQVKQQQVALRTGLDQQRAAKDDLLQLTKGQESAFAGLLAQKQREFAAQQASRGGNSTYKKQAKNPIFSFPVKSGYISQGYGMTEFARETNTYGGKIHNGVDVGNLSTGYPINSIGNGTVIGVGFSPSGGWGNWVMVQHENGFVSLYAHLWTGAYVSVGQSVNSETVLGGNGGTPYWPAHLHFSLYSSNPGVTASGPAVYAEKTVDPLDFMNITISTSGTDWDPNFAH